jgi:hypothetical protein
VAVDWDSTSTSASGCWVHTNNNDLQQHYSAPGVTQYEIVTHCTTAAMTSTSPAPCQPTWIQRNQTQSVGATLVVYPLSATDCLNQCAVSPTCVAVDMVISCSPPQCWVHSNRANLNVKYYSAVTVQYELVTRCATVAPAPPDVCGGLSAEPGQLCQPCYVAESPPRTCTVQRWATSYTLGLWITQLVTVQTPCTMPSCQQGATLATIHGVQTCVWIGWTSWSSCGSPCSGRQHRYYWDIVGSQYVIYENDYRTCDCK